MNRLYRKPTVNPAFKLRQPLPLLAMILEGKRHDRAGLPATGSGKELAPTPNEPRQGGSSSLCKNFAFNNLF